LCIRKWRKPSYGKENRLLHELPSWSAVYGQFESHIGYETVAKRPVEGFSHGSRRTSSLSVSPRSSGSYRSCIHGSVSSGKFTRPWIPTKQTGKHKDTRKWNSHGNFLCFSKFSNYMNTDIGAYASHVWLQFVDLSTSLLLCNAQYSSGSLVVFT
jgi:hypothetical protein